MCLYEPECITQVPIHNASWQGTGENEPCLNHPESAGLLGKPLRLVPKAVATLDHLPPMMTPKIWQPGPERPRRQVALTNRIPKAQHL